MQNNAQDTFGRPNHLSPVAGQVAQLLGSCFQESMNADTAAGCLDNLRSFLPEQFHAYMTALSDEIRSCAGLLREVVEQSHTHYHRVPVLLDHLAVLLPCLGRTLKDIKDYYEDKTKTKEIRWRTMYHKMAEEAFGIPLPQRFVLYNQFLILIVQMLSRSQNFDMNALEVLQNRILQLREKRGIAPPPPSQAGPLVAQTLHPGYSDHNVHWAEDIFSRPLPHRTPLKHLKQSMSYGPWGDVRLPPSQAKILFRRWFDQDRLSVIVYINPHDGAPYVIMRSLQYGSKNPLYSVRGIHELVISRDGSCLLLKRWSQSENCSKLWAVLYFITWEEMVLFHCSFVALKCENPMTHDVGPQEFKISKEKKLFQARIIDDGFKHSLLVYRDIESRGLRLHAAVWDGEMRQCPVWTAFVTHQSQSAAWLVRKDKNSIWVNDLQLYVFCNVYRQENMRQNKSGAFELNFVTEEAAQRFKEVFEPPPPPPLPIPENSDRSDASESIQTSDMAK